MSINLNRELSEESGVYQTNSDGFGKYCKILEGVDSMNSKTEKCFLIVIILLLSVTLLIEIIKDVIQ